MSRDKMQYWSWENDPSDTEEDEYGMAKRPKKDIIDKDAGSKMVSDFFKNSEVLTSDMIS